MSEISVGKKRKSIGSRMTFSKWLWELTVRRFLRNWLFLLLTLVVALVNTTAAVCSIGLSVLLIAAPFRYEDTTTNMKLFFSPVDTTAEALLVGAAGVALLVFSVFLLAFIGEGEIAAARRLLKVKRAG